MSNSYRGIKYLFSLCFVLLFFFAATLVLFPLDPPTKEQIEKYRADGTLSLRIEKAKEFGNHRISKDLIENIKYRLRKISGELAGTSYNNISETLSPPPAWKGMPTKGNVKIPVLLISFQDKSNVNSKQLINNKIFGTGSQSDSPLESLRSFYSRSSYGQLNITGNVLGWYKTPYPRSSVVENWSGRESLIREVINHYDDLGHDFSQYDNDGDGDIDYIAVIWSGQHGEWASFWWAYQTSVGDQAYKVDGKNLSIYSWQWEARHYPAGQFEPSTLIHETGHALGLPDLYDYESGVGPDGGVGGLDIMDAGYGDHNCFHKYLLDWIEPVVVNSGTERISLNPSATSKDSLLVMPGATMQTLFGEFFMIQNRYRKGNDIDYPASGLLIWHIDSTLDETGDDFKYDNSYSDHKYVRLMEADGLEEIEAFESADEGDYYLPGYEFGPATSPDSRKYDGINSGVFINEIEQDGEIFSFTAGVDIPVKINISGERRVEKSWLLKNRYGFISFDIEFLKDVDVARYIIQRKKEKGLYKEIKEVFPSDLTDNSYVYYDKYLEEERTYSYKVIAYDTWGKAIGVSQEITI